MRKFDPETMSEIGLIGVETRLNKAYFRKGWLKMLLMPPAKMETYEPQDNLEDLLKRAIIKAGTHEGVKIVALLREAKEAIGERIGSNWKATRDHDIKQSMPTIINTIPKPDRDEVPN